MILIDSPKACERCYAVASIERGLLYVAGAGYVGLSALSDQWVLVLFDHGELVYDSIETITDFVHIDDGVLCCWEKVTGNFFVPDVFYTKHSNEPFWIVAPNHRYLTIRERFRHPTNTIVEILNMRKPQKTELMRSKPFYLAIATEQVGFSMYCNRNLVPEREQVAKLLAVITDGDKIKERAECRLVPMSVGELKELDIIVFGAKPADMVSIPSAFLTRTGWYLPILPTGGTLLNKSK